MGTRNKIKQGDIIEFYPRYWDLAILSNSILLWLTVLETCPRPSIEGHLGGLWMTNVPWGGGALQDGEDLWEGTSKQRMQRSKAQRTSFAVKLMSIESVMPSKHLILCLPLFLLCSIFPSIRVFSNEESALHIRWPKYWSFSFSISPSSEYSGLIFFRTDWFDLLAVQGTLKSLLQHHSSKTSILPLSTFFTAQHRYMTTGKTIALTIQTFVGKVLSLLLNMLFRVIIAFLPRSKHLLISWLLNMF